MSTAAVIAAAADDRGRRRVVEEFRQNGATSAATAMPFHPIGRHSQRAFDRFVSDHVIVALPGGHYWLDEATLVQSTAQRRQRALGFVLVAAIVLLIVLAAVVLLPR